MYIIFIIFSQTTYVEMLIFYFIDFIQECFCTKITLQNHRSVIAILLFI